MSRQRPEADWAGYGGVREATILQIPFDGERRAERLECGPVAAVCRFPASDAQMILAKVTQALSAVAEIVQTPAVPCGNKVAR